jgi:hypothetical protein
MLERAAGKRPDLKLACADLQGEWPQEFCRPFDLVVSTYALHHFPLEGKIRILQRVFHSHCAPRGLVLVGDVSFPSVRAREEGAAFHAERWDPDEFYWAADETLAASEEAGMAADYRQVSACGGVYRFRQFADPGLEGYIGR